MSSAFRLVPPPAPFCSVLVWRALTALFSGARVQCDLDAKYFTALLTGLIKRQFYKDESITHAFLKAQLFAGSKMPADSTLPPSPFPCPFCCSPAVLLLPFLVVSNLLADLERTLSVAALEDWTIDALAKHLSQVPSLPLLPASFGRMGIDG